MTAAHANEGPLLLLDGAGLWFRAFHALPEKMTAPDGRPVNAIRGFIDMVAALIERERPTRLVVCLDNDWRPAFRTELIPSYKAHRVAADDPSGTVEVVPDTLSPQVELIISLLDAIGLTSAGADGFEADDVIGTLAFEEHERPVVVVSGDRDLLQVVADDPVPVRVLYVGRGLAKAKLYGPDEVAEDYGVPRQRAGSAYAEMAILRGDPSDGLPGVSGIGEKTAARLLTEFGDLDTIESAARRTDPQMTTRVASAITGSADYLAAARDVVFVRTDTDPVSSGDGSLPSSAADPGALETLITELGVGSSVGRLTRALGW